MRILTSHIVCSQAVEATKLIALLSGTLAIMAVAAYVVILSFWVSRGNVCSGAELHCVRCDCAYISVRDQTNFRGYVLGMGSLNSSLVSSFVGRHAARSLFEYIAIDLNHRCSVEALRV